MSEFEFVFSLFGLLLGFSLIEVLGGLARTIEALLRTATVRAPAPGSAPFRSGWLTPLLAVFVMLDILSFWGAAWVSRAHLEFSGSVMAGGLFFAGSYYVAAHLVFPTERADWADLDAHYFRVRRTVFAALIGLTTLQLAFMLPLPGIGDALLTPRVAGTAAVLYALMIAGMLVRGKAASIAVLALLSVRYVFEYVT